MMIYDHASFNQVLTLRVDERIVQPALASTNVYTSLVFLQMMIYNAIISYTI